LWILTSNQTKEKTMQTSYADGPAAHRAGDLYDNSPNTTVTRVASTAIPFGRILTKDGTTSDNLVKLPSAASDITDVKLIQGMARRVQTVPNQPDVEPDSYRAKDAIAVLQVGRGVVLTEQSVTTVDPVYVRYTANGSGKYPGQVRKDVDTDKAALFASARFLHSAGANTLVAVEYAIP
jgi:hypothetical protein